MKANLLLQVCAAHSQTWAGLMRYLGKSPVSSLHRMSYVRQTLSGVAPFQSAVPTSIDVSRLPYCCPRVKIYFERDRVEEHAGQFPSDRGVPLTLS